MEEDLNEVLLYYKINKVQTLYLLIELEYHKDILQELHNFSDYGKATEISYNYWVYAYEYSIRQIENKLNCLN